MISVDQGCIKAVMWPRGSFLIWTCLSAYYSSFHFSQPMFWSPLSSGSLLNSPFSILTLKILLFSWTPHHPFTQPTLTAPAAPGKHFHDTPFFLYLSFTSLHHTIIPSTAIASYLPPLQTEQLKEGNVSFSLCFLNLT